MGYFGVFSHLSSPLPALLDALDLQRFNERLHAGAELSGIAVVVQTVDRKDRPVLLFRHNVADERALKAPVVAVLHLFIDDALGAELAGKTVGGVTALLDLFIGDVAGAFGMLHVVQAELRKYVVGVVELNDLAARRGAEAVAVGNYERACSFQ